MLRHRGEYTVEDQLRGPRLAGLRIVADAVDKLLTMLSAPLLEVAFRLGAIRPPVDTRGVAGLARLEGLQGCRVPLGVHCPSTARLRSIVTGRG